MAKKYILAIDQGTTGSRAFIFDDHGHVVSSAYQEFTQHFPKPGWVEHDAEEIWKSCRAVIRKAIHMARIRPSQIAAIGITNQRETVVLWDRKTGKPIHRAIVWQDRRTASICEDLKKRGFQKLFQRKTGLVLDPYFSGTKIKWYLDHIRGLRKRAMDGNICAGTIDSWLIWKLTGGRSHITDYTNASRTLIFNIHSKQFDDELLKILDIPRSMLPDVQASASLFGKMSKGLGVLPEGIPITGVAGDQQAALFGQNCVKQGQLKNTYGTGSFIMMNTGDHPYRSQFGLITTIACGPHGEPAYALEGSVFISGAAIQWLRDGLKIIDSASESERLARSVPDNGGVYFVPALVGLGAPYWRSDVRGLITGLTRGTTRAHIIRAALESMAYQTHDVVRAMEKDSGLKVRELAVDGGACQNNWLMQFQADILGAKVVRPTMIETTAWGAAALAGVGIDIWKPGNLAKISAHDRTFHPAMPTNHRDLLLACWQEAMQKSLT